MAMSILLVVSILFIVLLIYPVWSLFATVMLIPIVAIVVIFYRGIMQQVRENNRVSVAVELPLNAPNFLVDQIGFLCEQQIRVPAKGSLKMRVLCRRDVAEQVIDLEQRSLR